MDTTELEMCLYQDPKVKRILGGVFPSDRLPQDIKDKKVFIANTDPAEEKGEHWVAFYFTPQGTCIYFDSYGLPPLVPSFIKFMERNALKWIFNSRKLQHQNSSVCGHYCLFFIFHMVRKVSLIKMLKLFDRRAHVNDRMVKYFVNKHYTLDKQKKNKFELQRTKKKDDHM